LFVENAVHITLSIFTTARFSNSQIRIDTLVTENKKAPMALLFFRVIYSKPTI
jgi:hypothetical protein